MKRIVTFFLPALFLLAVAASAQPSASLPSGDDVVAKMLQFDALRQSQLPGYTAIRHYVAGNNSRRAEMVVRVECASDGAKQFTVLSEGGSSAIRKHIFQKLLNEETEASRRGTRNSTRLTPENYEFKLVAKETIAAGPTYVFEVSPKTPNKYLIAGKIWVNADDYSIDRIEGQPARSPSFWVRSVHFVHTYQKVGQFWFASSTDTKSQIRVFGESELTITSSDYKLKSSSGPAELDHEARLFQ